MLVLCFLFKFCEISSSIIFAQPNEPIDGQLMRPLFFWRRVHPGTENRAPKLLSSHCLYQTEFDEYNTPIYSHHLFKKLLHLCIGYIFYGNIIVLLFDYVIIISFTEEEFNFILLMYYPLFLFLHHQRIK